MTTGSDFALQKYFQKFDGRALLRHAAHFSQKFIWQDRNIRLWEPGGCEDIDHALRTHGVRNDLPGGVIQFLVRPSVAGRPFGEHGLKRLEKRHIIANTQRTLVRDRKREGL